MILDSILESSGTTEEISIVVAGFLLLFFFSATKDMIGTTDII